MPFAWELKRHSCASNAAVGSGEDCDEPCRNVVSLGGKRFRVNDAEGEVQKTCFGHKSLSEFVS